ncbi:MAG TPA: hypothetical protein IAA99_06260 [Candidatus Avibacteroides faecavium]|nr:hypothetical protein [Candidatus Avibacteroides faecavium]
MRLYTPSDMAALRNLPVWETHIMRLYTIGSDNKRCSAPGCRDVPLARLNVGRRNQTV